jgi:hypothetical protein
MISLMMLHSTRGLADTFGSRIRNPRYAVKEKAPAFGDRGSKDGRRGKGRLGDTFRREVNFFS